MKTFPFSYLPLVGRSKFARANFGRGTDVEHRLPPEKCVPHFSTSPQGGGKIVAVLIVASLALSACGVKSDLVRPDGKTTAKGQNDPSRPPQPIGQ